MNSPARSSFQRKAAQAARPAAGPRTLAAPPMAEGDPAAAEQALLLAALGQDLRELQSIQSIERKVEAKRTKIARYLPWIEGQLAAEQPVQDEVVATMAVWAIDVADWPLALRLGAHVLAHGLSLPERYRRQPATLIAEEVAEAGLATVPAVDLATLQQVATLTAGNDMPDQVRAKLAKAIGLALKHQADVWDAEAESAPAGGKPALIDAALAQFETALRLDAKSGVKKLIEALERERKRLASGAA